MFGPDERSTVLKGHTGRVFSLAIVSLPDGTRIAASASHDRTVRIWSLDTLELIRTLHYRDFVWRVFLALTPTPCVVAFISAEDRIQVSHLETGEMIHELYGRLLFVGNVPIFKHPVILTGLGVECQDISFTDVLSGQTLCVVHGSFDRVFRAVFTSGTKHQNFDTTSPLLVFTTWNSQNRQSTIQTYELTAALTAGCYGASSSSNGSLGDVHVPVDTSLMNKLFDGDSRDGVTSLVISRSIQPLIVSGHYDFIIRLWSIQTQELLLQLEGHDDYIGSVAVWRGLHMDVIVSSSSDGTIKVWDISDVGHAVAGRDGKTLDTIDKRNMLIYTDSESHQRDVWALAVSKERDGNKPLIVSGSFDRTVRVWDVNPLIADRKWARRKNFVLAMQYSYLLERKTKVPSAEAVALAALSLLRITTSATSHRFPACRTSPTESRRSSHSSSSAFSSPASAHLSASSSSPYVSLPPSPPLSPSLPSSHPAIDATGDNAASRSNSDEAGSDLSITECLPASPVDVPPPVYAAQHPLLPFPVRRVLEDLEMLRYIAAYI